MIFVLSTGEEDGDDLPLHREEEGEPELLQLIRQNTVKTLEEKTNIFRYCKHLKILIIFNTLIGSIR